VLTLQSEIFFGVGEHPILAKISLDTRMGTGFAGEFIFSRRGGVLNKSCAASAPVKSFLTI
jgi:hypothetical protein